MNSLVLSLFPGIGLLDRAFEEAGFCIVRGPDLLWGGDVKRFHPPAGVFGGIIGGPPCQPYSRLRHLVQANGLKTAECLIPEFVRCVEEAKPEWFLMENVAAAPLPETEWYRLHSQLFNNRWCGAEQNRVRRLTFGTKAGKALHIESEALQIAEWSPAVCASGGVKPGIPSDRSVRGKYLGWKTAEALKESIRLQGLPEGFLDEAPFTLCGKHQVIGNGVPLPMGRAIAAAVKRALESAQ